MLITRTEVKDLLGMDDTKDAKIDYQIPIVEQDIVDYCNDHFIDKIYDYINSYGITFINSDNSINLTGLEAKKLVANDTIRIYRSFRNNQIFTVDSVETNKIVCNSIDSIADENENEYIYITRIQYPIPLKFVACAMIKYNIDKFDNVLGAKSEKIDDYSITYDVDSGNLISGYPSNIMGSLSKYRKPYKKTLMSYINRGAL